MATRRKKPQKSDFGGEPDPKAPLNGSALLDAAKPLLKLLSEDLLARADASAAVTTALQKRHDAERRAERTADSYPEWRRQFTIQVAAAWFLSCVFVRTLEDRGLLGRLRLAGDGALDSQRAFFALAPSLNERDYLYFVFRELARPGTAAEDLFDARHNPVWLLAPSADSTKKLLEFFRLPTADAPAFRFGGADTRFLGDLYQDLSEDVRKRYALLQTPRFVERFILDRTLDRALERFGLEETNLIDPTCGSGHFLLGAFERLFERRLQAEPGVDPRQAALKALDAVAGADINPYAVAIARFRLALTVIEKAGFTRLRDVPKLPLHVVVADSLLHNPQLQQMELGDLGGTDVAAWKGAEFALEDPRAAREVLHRQYAAVVGNPPYITVKDPVLRERYRGMYPKSAAGKYSVAVPFTERFFQLARTRGYVGMITANSFMKREFGKKLIEEYLPTVNLDVVINTSGAYIPGHGTPTVLLFGSAETAQGADVLAVLASRGEPATPDDPEQGRVWTSIAGHWSDVGFENEYITVVRTERKRLEKHPWSLGGGGAAELKEVLEERAEKRLGELTTIGVFGMTNADEVMLMAEQEWSRTPVEDEFVRTLAIGEDIRDWSWSTQLRALYPYRWPSQLLREGEAPGVFKYLWPYRTVLGNRATFGGGTYFRDGLAWWKWHQVTESRVEGPAITFAFVATHNHFVLDRGGKVFKQSAPIIKLAGSATEEDHLALLAYLNSSMACFWMKQVCHGKTNHTDDRPETFAPGTLYFEFTATGISRLPLLLNRSRDRLIELARRAERIVRERETLAATALADRLLAAPDPERVFVEADRALTRLDRLLIENQENVDWQTYFAAGLVGEDAAAASKGESGTTKDQRPFCADAPPREWCDSDQRLWSLRRATIRTTPAIAMIENDEFKRRWIGVGRGSFAHAARTFREECQDALAALLLTRIEQFLRVEARASTAAQLCRSVLGSLETQLQWATGRSDASAALSALLPAHAVPFLSCQRFEASGIEKHSAWQRTWDLQRGEDCGRNVGHIPVPPRYAQDDFRDALFWRLRGKLDVPKERFISYPGCESDQDGEPVYGWAGWDHLQRAVALADLYQKRKLDEGWTKDRLRPMLAGLLELLPWLKQWHNEPSAELDGARPGDQFAEFLDAECAEHGLTHDDLRAWRPQEGRRAKRLRNGGA